MCDRISRISIQTSRHRHGLLMFSLMSYFSSSLIKRVLLQVRLLEDSDLFRRLHSLLTVIFLSFRDFFAFFCPFIQRLLFFTSPDLLFDRCSTGFMISIS